MLDGLTSSLIFLSTWQGIVIPLMLIDINFPIPQIYPKQIKLNVTLLLLK